MHMFNCAPSVRTLEGLLLFLSNYLPEAIFAGNMHMIVCCKHEFCTVQPLTACMLTEFEARYGIGLLIETCTPCLLIAADLRPSMGDPKSDFIVTMHCVVRAAGFGKSAGLHPLSCPSHAQCGGSGFLCGLRSFC